MINLSQNLYYKLCFKRKAVMYSRKTTNTNYLFFS